MKKIFFFILLLYTITGYSQTGMELLIQLPSLPSPICITDTVELERFHTQLRKVTRQLDSLSELRRAKLEDRIKNVNSEVEKNIAQDFNLSESDLQKLKQKKLSDSEKKALMDKMLKDKANISMKQIEQLKKMKKEGNKEGIRNWAEAYQTQQMAGLVSGDSTKTPEMIEFEKNLAKNKDLNDLMKEQKLIIDRIAVVDKRITNKMIEFHKVDSIETAARDNCIKPLEEQLTKYPDESLKQNLMMQIAMCHLAYCEKISPMYIDIITDLKLSTEPLIPTYNRLEIINAEINAKTLGLKEWPTDPGLMELEAVKSLAHAIADVFKYTLVPPSRN